MSIWLGIAGVLWSEMEGHPAEQEKGSLVEVDLE
jgi:hypothetical protein